ncbi:hypothetical protein F2Q68_00030272 [Brassica cretica]|uniref:Uncharacterized protein n=1 Tax=Brassica cretica TaxID=69181 RepID=A0A8S9G4Y9_BRACR|nr:hypothetical protein F2Q68_00030272 [Brassica cretica]
MLATGAATSPVLGIAASDSETHLGFQEIAPLPPFRHTFGIFLDPKVGSEIGSWSVLAEAVMSNDASSLGVREPLMDLGDVGEMVILLVFSDPETDSEIGSWSSLAEAVCREAKTSFEILESFGEPELKHCAYKYGGMSSVNGRDSHSIATVLFISLT